ncbi:hypothetical protein AVEN_200517-1 [Araneus ventricosus]|uniref:Uncharacterized protein n=1 Tax=Araneus ventricosus TaxID=182803 RepID=A0A4Y2MPU8_ARAVE|nr:hypothetical protein AVEN_200517-1 [Araneus ventricosus]
MWRGLKNPYSIYIALSPYGGAKIYSICIALSRHGGAPNSIPCTSHQVDMEVPQILSDIHRTKPTMVRPQNLSDIHRTKLTGGPAKSIRYVRIETDMRGPQNLSDIHRNWVDLEGLKIYSIYIALAGLGWGPSKSIRYTSH